MVVGSSLYLLDQISYFKLLLKDNHHSYLTTFGRGQHTEIESNYYLGLSATFAI